MTRKRKNFNLLGRKSSLQQMGESYLGERYPQRRPTTPERPKRVKKTGPIARESEGWGKEESEKALRAWERRYGKNPCARTRKDNVTDRAKRYRANQPGCRPSGVKQCKLCGAKRDLMIHHKDGNESNGRKSNLAWACRSCNNALGAEMARTGQGRRTIQYNPQGAQTLGEYVLAVLQHTRGAHDEGGRLIHATPKWKRQEYASEIWAARKGRGNPSSWGYGIYQGRGFDAQQVAHFKSKAAAETYARSAGLKRYSIKRAFSKNENPAVSPEQYRLAQAVRSGTARETSMSQEAAREIVDRTPAKLRSAYSRGNPSDQSSTEYRLGYNLGQTDRQTASLAKTWRELEATFDAMIPDGTRASALPFFEGYKAGYGLAGGTTAGNPSRQEHSSLSRRNPERDSLDDGSEEYQQAKRTAELFHGRPVKEQIEVDEQIRTHDWYVSIGPLIKLIIKPVTKEPKSRVPLPFHRKEGAIVHLFVSPDGRQFYLRGGDQELDLDAFGMGEGSAWYRDHMLIGEAVEITYEDRKKFHSFKLIDYFHKLGEQTRIKPTLAYNSLAKKLSIVGGQYRIEMDDLVDGMSPGIVN